MSLVAAVIAACILISTAEAFAPGTYNRFSSNGADMKLGEGYLTFEGQGAVFGAFFICIVGLLIGAMPDIRKWVRIISTLTGLAGLLAAGGILWLAYHASPQNLLLWEQQLQAWGAI
jgi:hypothetical protein